MAHPTILRAKAWAWPLLLLLLAGCCANNVCNCVGEAREDAVQLVLAPAGLTAADLDTLVVQRYPKAARSNVRPDVVTIVRPASRANQPDTLVLNNTTPFPQQGTTKLNGYSYRVRFLRHLQGQRPNAALLFRIDSVQLRGRLDGDGCCTCYTNSYKALYLRAAPDSLAASDSLMVLPRSGIYVIRR